MKPNLTPISSFLYRDDADRACDLLEKACIDATVRDANDPPEGYRVLTRQIGFTLWVAHPGGEKALELLRRAGPKPLLCESCGIGHATEHVTVIRNDQRETKHLCSNCFASSSIT